MRYEELDRILNSLKFYHAKGEQKQGLIFEFIPHVNVVNIYRVAWFPAIGSIDTYPAVKIVIHHHHQHHGIVFIEI